MKSSVEIAGAAFGALALFAFRHILDAAVFEKGFHFHFSTTRAVEAMGSTGRTGVFANLSHNCSLEVDTSP